MLKVFIMAFTLSDFDTKINVIIGGLLMKDPSFVNDFLSKSVIVLHLLHQNTAVAVSSVALNSISLHSIGAYMQSF